VYDLGLDSSALNHHIVFEL